MDGVESSVHRLLEQMHDEVSRPTLSRVRLQNLTDLLTTQCMVATIPGVETSIFDDLGLTKSELCLAKFMHKRLGRFLTREQMMTGRETAGIERDILPKTVDVYVHKLRRKLVGTGFCIENTYSRGYRMVAVSDTTFLTSDQVQRQQRGELDKPVSRDGFTMSEAVARYFDLLSQGRAMSGDELRAITHDSHDFVRSRLAQLRAALEGRIGRKVVLRSTVPMAGRRWQLVEIS